jgi:hypothetical protein
VSNRRRLTRPVPPPAVAALAASYECGHCDADIGRPYRDADGIWHLAVAHDDGCPVLGGTVPVSHAGRRAARAAAAATGAGALYIATEPEEQP